MPAGDATVDPIFTELDRRLAIGLPQPIAVGVSGGSDSLALLMIATAWATRAGRPVAALTVDHGLHPQSAAWTAQAGVAARRLGARWRSLAWRGPKPAAGLPAAARRARHALLAEAARESGAAVLLLGHTADDVAESELIRRDTPIHGRFSAWAPSPVWPEGRGIFLLRPLLRTARSALRTRLAAEGLDWLDDPANADVRYARSRARLRLADIAPGVAAAPEPQVHAVHARATADGAVAVDREVDAATLARALLCASGGERPPRLGELARLLQRIQAAPPFVATLGGARVSADAAGATLVRDAGERTRGGLAPLTLTPQAPQVFDGRFELTCEAAGWTAEALAGRGAGLCTADRAALKAVSAAVRPGLPVLVGPDGAARLPRPFGDGPGSARALAPARLAAACGLIVREGQLLAAQPDDSAAAGG